MRTNLKSFLDIMHSRNTTLVSIRCGPSVPRELTAELTLERQNIHRVHQKDVTPILFMTHLQCLALLEKTLGVK